MRTGRRVSSEFEKQIRRSRPRSEWWSTKDPWGVLEGATVSFMCRRNHYLYVPLYQHFIRDATLLLVVSFEFHLNYPESRVNLGT